MSPIVHSSHDRLFKAAMADTRVARDFLPHLEKSFQVLRDLEQKGAGDYVVLLLNYALNSMETGSLARFIDCVQEGLSLHTKGDQMLCITELLKQRGIEEGLKQGKQEGLRKGESTLFIRQLNRKFGTIPSSYLARIESADEEQLLLWGERLLDANNWQNIFQD